MDDILSTSFSAMAEVPPAVADAFPQFSQLPTELRLRVWNAFHEVTLPNIINVDIVLGYSFFSIGEGCCGDGDISAYSMKKIPSILHVCTESRLVGLGRYSLGFDAPHADDTPPSNSIVDGRPLVVCKHQKYTAKERKGIYWDRTKDVVAIRPSGIVSHSEPIAYTWEGNWDIRFRNIKRIAFHSSLRSMLPGLSNLDWEKLEDIFLFGEIPGFVPGEHVGKDCRTMFYFGLGSAAFRMPSTVMFVEDIEEIVKIVDLKRG